MRKKILIGCVVALCSSAFITTASVAHHGVNGQFDLSKTLEKTGIVTRVRFVNPHSYVYFDVTNDGGEVEKWRCELRSGSLLKRKGWTTDMFAIGSEITILGSPARSEPTTCYTETITFADGRKLIRYGEVDDDGKFINPEKDANATADRAGREPASDVPDLSGNWSEPIANGPPLPYAGRAPAYVLTQAAKDAADNWVAEDNPRFSCKPTNIILDYRFDQMINNIEQTASEVKLTYGFMDVERTIHIDTEFPSQIEPSVTGYSIGKWEGNKLDVLTKGFAPGFLEAIGGRSTRSIPHSDQMEITETFYVDDAGELVHEYTIVDPVNLAEPHSHLQKSVKTDHAYEPFNCDDLTVEEAFIKN